MQIKPPLTLLVRHRQENKKKCSLEPIKERSDCLFLNYPSCELPPLDHYVLLSFEGPLLSKNDYDKGLILIDGTWKKASVMERQLFKEIPILKRSLPIEFITAYPRRQPDCQNPDQGLASIEALYVAYLILKRDPAGLLDRYFWKNHFLEKNRQALARYSF